MEASTRQWSAALAADAKLRGIVGKYQSQLPPLTNVAERNASLANATYHDPEFRLVVGMHFLGKLQVLAHSRDAIALPDRPFVNDPNVKKKPHKGHPVLDRVTSREAVALLCVAKLDGTFDVTEQGDPVTYGKGGNTGQHRLAADMLLNDYAIEEDGAYRLWQR